MPPRAVLFDFDGVRADTENVHVAAWERTLHALALDTPPEVCIRAAEQDDRDFLRERFAERSIEGGDIAGWVAHKQAITRALLADAPYLYPGVRELLDALAGRVPLAVVTGTWRANAQIVLGAAGVLDRFSLVVGKEDAEAPKPAPDVYRVALQRLQVPPEAAIALEDSPSGLASAQAAGLPVLAIGHRRPDPAWAVDAAVPFLPDLTDLPRTLAALGFVP